jgi:hypothetical protein
MKGGKHGQGPRNPAPAGDKAKPGPRGAASKKAGDRPRSVAPKKGARRKPFGGSSSTEDA